MSSAYGVPVRRPPGRKPLKSNCGTLTGRVLLSSFPLSLSRSRAHSHGGLDLLLLLLPSLFPTIRSIQKLLHMVGLFGDLQFSATIGFLVRMRSLQRDAMRVCDAMR